MIKVICGITLSWIYMYYYPDRSTADIFKYFDDSKIMFNALSEKPVDFFQMFFGIANDNSYFDENYYSKMNHWFRPFASNYYNDTHIIIRFNALVRTFSFGYFNVHTIFMNFLSFTGLIAFYKLFSNFSQISKRILFLGLFFTPSILFWGSGVLKEGLLLFVIGFLCQSLFRIIHKGLTFKHILISILTSYLMIRLKFYVLILIIPPFISYLWIYKTKNTKPLLKHIVVLLLFIGIGLNLKFIAPQYNPLLLLQQKQSDFICLAEFMNSGSTIHLSRFEPTTEGLITILPEALSNALFRPFLWESNSYFTAVSAIENIFLLLFAIVAIFLSKNKANIDWNLLLYCLVFVLSMYAIIGITTPVLGAMVRYKLPTIPFYILGVASLINLDKVNRKFPLLKNYICD